MVSTQDGQDPFERQLELIGGLASGELKHFAARAGAPLIDGLALLAEECIEYRLGQSARPGTVRFAPVHVLVLSRQGNLRPAVTYGDPRLAFGVARADDRVRVRTQGCHPRRAST